MMRDYSLLIVIGVILVKICSSDSKNHESDYDEPVRMASESLVVQSYKDSETTTGLTTSTRGRRDEYKIYQGVMGRPGIDFPVYPSIPATSFSCRGVKKSGYYADLETDCQVFHICDGHRKISFLCPNGTIFRQSHLICDWWFRVDCNKSLELYEESAEQLEADQRVYRARSEERERRRKQGKSLSLGGTAATGGIDTAGGTTGSEAYAIDRNHPESIRNQYSTTSRAQSRFDGRKAERHSKKVVDPNNAEKFSNYNRDKQRGEKLRSFKDRYSTSAPSTVQAPEGVGLEQDILTIQSTPGYKSEFTVQSNNYIDKENIQQAESGRVVDDFNRNQNLNFGYTSRKTENKNFGTSRQPGTTSFSDSEGSTGSYPYNNKRTSKYKSYRDRQVESTTASFNTKGDVTGYNNNQNEQNTVSTERTESTVYSNNVKQTERTYKFNNRERLSSLTFNSRFSGDNKAANNEDNRDNQRVEVTVTSGSTAPDFVNYNSNSQATEGVTKPQTIPFGFNSSQIIEPTTARYIGGNTNFLFNNNGKPIETITNQSRTGKVAFITVKNADQPTTPGKGSSGSVNFTYSNNKQQEDITVSSRTENFDFGTVQNEQQPTTAGPDVQSRTEIFGYGTIQNDQQPTTTARNIAETVNYGLTGSVDDQFRTTRFGFEQKPTSESFAGKNYNYETDRQIPNLTTAARVTGLEFTEYKNAEVGRTANTEKNSNTEYIENPTFAPVEIARSTIFEYIEGKTANPTVDAIYKGDEVGYKSKTENPTTGYVPDNGNPNFAYTTTTRTDIPTTVYDKIRGITDYSFIDKKTEVPEIGTTGYTTEYPVYESKRTVPLERQQTILPTRKTHSSRFRSSTPSDVEQERQHLAETASFHSNRDGKSFPDYRNSFNTFDTSTPGIYKAPYYSESISIKLAPPAPTFSSTGSSLKFNEEVTVINDYFANTGTYKTPVKQNSRKVELFPSTQPQITTTSYGAWQTTTYPPYVETTTDKFTSGEVFYSTSAPERELEVVTNDIELPQKDAEVVLSTTKPEIDISLHQLTIRNQTEVVKPEKSYEDYVREGLEVPPSSGPNALRSFALYFATTGRSIEDTRAPTYLPTGETEYATTLNSYEARKKELVKQVEEIVQKNSAEAVDLLKKDAAQVKTDEALPNSLLTPHTQHFYSTLFPNTSSETNTSMSERVDDSSTEFGTTSFESFTEEPNKINAELTKNDLDGSQSRGLVEPEQNADTISPDLRELAQVFTKALSAYLDDPEAFRKVLSEIRPTEPTADSDGSGSNSNEYPSATKEDDEVLDFSDVTKSTYKKKATTTTGLRETTIDYYTEAPTTSVSEIDNLVVPFNTTSWATNIELTAPLFETLDQSQSSYYTPPPFIGTTNGIAEEINKGFTGGEDFSQSNVKTSGDSYLPIKGSVDDPSLPRYGGFHNNTRTSKKYVPYGAELTSTTYRPYGADLTTTEVPVTVEEERAATINPQNVTSFFSHFSKNETEEEEIQLAKELNNLVLLQKFTTPRGNAKEETTTQPDRLSTVAPLSEEYQDVVLGNGEILEKKVSGRGGRVLHFPETPITSNYFEPSAREINLELSPPSSTPKGFLITYALQSTVSSEPATYLPTRPPTTTTGLPPTTYSPVKEKTTEGVLHETPPPASYANFESGRIGKSRTEYYTTTSTVAPTTEQYAKSTKSIERIAELQETLMFNSNNLTVQQKDLARVSVEEMMDTLNMTDSTAHALMKVMEMAAKNETYRRLVLLLVNDKSGKNKTVQESRLSLLKALLTPVINPQQTRTVVPIPDTSKLALEEPETNNLRRGKSISTNDANVVQTTTKATTTTLKRTSNVVRRVKVGRGLTRPGTTATSLTTTAPENLGNLGIIKRTIENSKSKQIRFNAIDDAILNSDSRAVELLRSLYSLAARWG